MQMFSVSLKASIYRCPFKKERKGKERNTYPLVPSKLAAFMGPTGEK